MSRPLRIVRVITRLIVGGAQHTALNLSSLLDPERFETLLVTGHQTGSEGSLFHEAERRGVRVEIVPTLRRELNPVLYAAALRSIRRIIRRERPDIVHTHSTEAGILGRIAAHREGVPVILHTVHGWGFHEHMNRLLQLTNVAAERRVAGWTQKLIVVTGKDRAKGLGAGIGRPDQYEVIRSAIDLSRIRGSLASRMEARHALGVPQDALVVGTVGRLSRQKDPEAFVRIGHAVLRRVPGVYLVFVGDGPLRGSVEQLSGRLGIERRLVLTGIRPDVLRLLPGFDVFTLTSRWEGLPRAVLEAMAAGVPVVAPAVDGLSELIEDQVTGLLVPPGDEAAQAEAIHRLLTDAALSRGIAHRAAEAMGEYDLPAMVEKTGRLYEELALRAGISDRLR